MVSDGQVRQAIELASAIEDTEERDEAIGFIALEQAVAGNPRAVLPTIELIKRNRARNKSSTEVIVSFAEMGNIAGALAIAERSSLNDYQHNSINIAIAEAQYAAGDRVAAEQNLLRRHPPRCRAGCRTRRGTSLLHPLCTLRILGAEVAGCGVTDLRRSTRRLNFSQFRDARWLRRPSARRHRYFT